MRKDLHHQIGEPMEVALWFNGQHGSERVSARVGCQKALDLYADEADITFSSIVTEELAPGDARVGEPPKEFQGSPRILLATARVVALTKPSVILGLNPSGE